MKKTIIGLSMALGLAGIASAENTVVVTHGAAKGGAASAALDFQSDGEARAFQFLLQLPKGASNVNTSKCLADLPKSHSGKCAASKDGSKVAVVVFSAANAALPVGIHSLGEISYRAPGGGQLNLDKMMVAGSDGSKSLPVSPKVVSVDDNARGQNRNERVK